MKNSLSLTMVLLCLQAFLEGINADEKNTQMKKVVFLFSFYSSKEENAFVSLIEEQVEDAEVRKESVF